MYHPFSVAADHERVQVWSIARPPFQPMGWKADMRAALRQALAGLRAHEGLLLHAVYAEADTGAMFDIENVLLYNVGTSAFTHLTRSGLRFERTFVVPPPLAELDAPALHYASYEMTEPSRPFLHWEPCAELASVTNIPLGDVTKPGPVWTAVRVNAEPPARTAPAPVRFCITVEVAAPAPTPSLANLAKPLLDGIISAYHCHIGSSDSVSFRLAAAGLGDSADIEARLRDPRWAALGPRVLVRPFGSAGVQWNPADDWCVAAEIRLGAVPATGKTVSATIRDVTNSADPP